MAGEHSAILSTSIKLPFVIKIFVLSIFEWSLKETKSATMNIFRFFFLFKSFVKVELSYVFTKNLFTVAENCTENELSYKTGVLVIVCTPPLIIDS